MSNIVFDSIDENFPVAGQDNDSQGFRDNFSIIRDGLATANSEITNLENKTAKLSDDNNDPVTNNFNGGIIENVRLKNAYRSATDTTDNDINVEDADYFRIAKSNNQPITLVWPDNTDKYYIKIRLEVIATGSRIVSFVGAKTNFVNVSDPTPPDEVQGITLSDGEIGIFDCWISDDDITKVFVQYIETFA